jgi:hypothetical protein
MIRKSRGGNSAYPSSQWQSLGLHDYWNSQSKLCQHVCMKYPSLQKVNLIVVDGRKSNSALRKFLNGALVALANRFDGHVLVLASSGELEKTYEAMGENAQQDMFFHAEAVEDSSEFINRCEMASLIVMISPWSTQESELIQLRESKPIFLSKAVSESTGIVTNLLNFKFADFQWPREKAGE